MQTFLPVANFKESARILDYRRLGKQRIEASQILSVLLNRTNSNAWRNHPACRMWAGYEVALSLYYNTVILEWVSRSYKNNMSPEPIDNYKLIFPSWFGDERFHSSHRGNLIRKDPNYYTKFGWLENGTEDYFWPTQNGF